MDIERARFNMIEQQIRPWDVLDQDVLDLLYIVRREDFVPEAYRLLAFSDLEIPLLTGGDAGERMLQPKLEARILQEIAPKPADHVLEIGAGSGYMAALLGTRARDVVTIEINPVLKTMAERNLARAGRTNVAVQGGDGARGWAAKAPYDIIVVSGSLPMLPAAFTDQLAVGGRLFVVLGEPPVMTATLLTKLPTGACNAIDLFETQLPPLRNAQQPDRFRF